MLQGIMKRNPAITPPDSAVIKFLPEHYNVLRGLLKRNPAMTLSAIVTIAIGPFCEANKEAATETEIQIEQTSERQEKVPE